MLESQADIDKLKYDRVTQGTQVNNYTFTSIDEASSFWTRLWEEEAGAPNENIVQNHLNIALLNVF